MPISGKKLWQKSFPSKVYPHHKFNSFASATPCVDHEYVFVSWTTKESNDLLCLDHNGALVWRRDFGRFQTQHGNGFSPIVEGEVVIVTHDHEVKSSILCLDRKTGRTLWKTDRDGSKPSSSTPLTYRTGQRRKPAIRKQFEISWLLRGGCPHRRNSLGNGPGHFGFAERILSRFCRRALLRFLRSGWTWKSPGGHPSAPEGISQKPKIAYVLEKNVPYVPTPLPFKDMLFLISDGGIASCLKTASGEVLWRERLEGNYFASPVLINGKVCIVSREGEVRILSITKEKMEVLGLSKLGEKTYNTPAISPKSIFFRTYSTIHCLNSI